MTAAVQTIVLADFDALDAKLSAMNEAGTQPVLPFIDANGCPSIAHGTAPGGDGWAIDYEAPRDEDGNRHCCDCCEHHPSDCYCSAMWEPTFPITALVVAEVTP